MKKFDPYSLEPWIYFTAEEWQAYWSVCVFWRARGSMPSMQPSQSTIFFVQTMVREHGVVFEALHPGSDGCLYTDAEEPVEENNAMSMALIRKGVAPDLEVHVPAAEKWLLENAHDFPMDEFRDFAREIQKAADDARGAHKALPESVKKDIREAIQQRSAAVEDTDLVH